MRIVLIISFLFCGIFSCWDPGIDATIALDLQKMSSETLNLLHTALKIDSSHEFKSILIPGLLITKSNNEVFLKR